MPSNHYVPAILLFVAGLAGCALPVTESTSVRQVATGAAGAVQPVQEERLATMKTYQYVRVDPERTGIANAADDGRFTYVAFSNAIAADMRIFDAEGNQLMVVRYGQVVALPGIYKGFLVRTGRFDSFVAPNPRASAADRPNLEADPDVIEARSRLEVATTQLPAMRRAIARADAQVAQGTLAGDGSTGAVARASPVTPAYTVPALPALKPVRAGDPTYMAVPNGVMIRVFFASGGRAIVRPDDGLQRLEVEASGASEIRISGYTDSIGTDEANSSLARSRAEAIRALMLKRGVAPEKMLVTWTGNGRYLAENSSESGRAKNRRVEVVFMKPSMSVTSARNQQ